MIETILPLLLAGAIHIWNPDGTARQITINVPELNISINFTAAPMSETVIPQNLPAGVAIVSGLDVKFWSDTAGVAFPSTEARTVWRMPVDATTGIAVANPQKENNFVIMRLHRANGTDVQTTIDFGALRSGSWFVNNLIDGEISGELIIEATLPLSVTAARCNAGGVCTIIPTY